MELNQGQATPNYGETFFWWYGIIVVPLYYMIRELLFGGPTLLTHTSSLSAKELRHIVKLATQWCVENFGVNNRRRTEFTVSIRQQKSGSPCYGQFDHMTNTITIFHNHCPNVRMVIRTLIHEYTHYMQPIAGSYYKLLDSYGYDNHPMEIEAREMELHYNNCWKYIKKKI